MKLKKVKKVIGYLIYNLFAQYLPVSYKKYSFFSKELRGFCARLILEECGNNVNIERNAQFSSKLKIGDNSGVGVRGVISGPCEIGKNVMMGPDCIIYTRNHRFDRIDVPMSEQGFYKEKPVIIKSDVWIGGRVTILPGVVIGNGVVVGANSVVTKSIPDYAVVGGNPAKVLKMRGDSIHVNRS